MTSMVKRAVIIPVKVSHFLTAQLLPLGRGSTTVTEAILVMFEFCAWDDDTSSWEQLGDDIDGEASDDFSGESVSLSSDGTIVAIGAMSNDGNGLSSGHVRVFAWDDDTSSWEQLGDDIDGEASPDASGDSVSLSSTAQLLPLGRGTTTVTDSVVVMFEFSLGTTTLRLQQLKHRW